MSNSDTHPGGRPAMYKTWEELQERIDNYFDDNDTPTISGLALFLGFSSRQSFYDYEKIPEFSYTIKRARLQIESNYEKALRTDKPTGAIFALKNLGWNGDKQILEHSGSLNTNNTLDPSKLSDKTLTELLIARDNASNSE